MSEIKKTSRLNLVAKSLFISIIFTPGEAISTRTCVKKYYPTTFNEIAVYNPRIALNDAIAGETRTTLQALMAWGPDSKIAGLTQTHRM